MPGEPGDQELAADGVRALAVHAGTGFGTGRGEPEALRVDRRGHVAGALHGAVHVVAHLVHPHDEDHLFRPLGDGGDPVGVSVDVHHHAVLGDGVGAGQIHVCVIGHEHGGALVRFLIPVDKVIVALLQGVRQADLVHAHAAAHGDGGALRDQLQRFGQGLLLIRGVIAGHVAGLQSPDHGLSEQLIPFDDILIHGTVPPLIFHSITAIIP